MLDFGKKILFDNLVTKIIHFVYHSSIVMWFFSTPVSFRFLFDTLTLRLCINNNEISFFVYKNLFITIKIKFCVISFAYLFGDLLNNIKVTDEVRSEVERVSKCDLEVTKVLLRMYVIVNPEVLNRALVTTYNNYWW